MNRLARAVSICLMSGLAAGCFEIEQTVDLEQDLSGSAGVTIGIDLEPMVLIMTTLKRGMEGKEGAPSEAELAAAREEFLRESQKDRSSDDSMKAQVEAELPEGLELLDLNVEENGLNIRTSFRFAFDRVSRLTDLRLPSGGDDPTKKNVIDSPFEGLEVVDAGDTLTIRTRPQNPAKSVEGETKGSMPVDKEMEAMMEKAMQNLRVAYRITAPFEVVSHNATRVEKNTLIWEYDLETFKRMDEAKLSAAEVLPIHVVYRK